MVDNPDPAANPALSPEIRQWIEEMFQLLRLGTPLVVMPAASGTDSTGEAGELAAMREDLGRRLAAAPIPRDASGKESGVLDALRDSIARALAAATDVPALAALEPQIVKLEQGAAAVARAVELRRARAVALLRRLREQQAMIAGAAGAPPALAAAFDAYLKAGARIATMLSGPLSDEAVARATAEIDDPLGAMQAALAGILERPRDPGMPEDGAATLEAERNRLGPLAQSDDLGALLDAWPAFAAYEARLDQSNDIVRLERQRRVDAANSLRARLQSLAMPTDADETETERLRTLQAVLPKLSQTDPPQTDIEAFDLALAALGDAAREIGEAVAERRREAEGLSRGLSELAFEPDLAQEARDPLELRRTELLAALEGVPSAAALPGLRERAGTLTREIGAANDGIVQRRKTLAAALASLSFDTEMPETECAEARTALTDAVNGAAARPALPSLTALEEGLEALTQTVAACNAAFDKRRTRAIEMRGKVEPLSPDEAGEPAKREAIIAERVRILKALEGVPTDEAMDGLDAAIAELVKRIEAMATWVAEQTLRRKTAIADALKAVVWPGFSPAQAKHLRGALDLQIKAADELWALDTVLPEMEKAATAAADLRAALASPVRRLALLPPGGPAGALAEETLAWTTLHARATGLLDALLDPAATGAPLAAIAALEAMEARIAQSVAARAKALPTAQPQDLEALAGALGGAPGLTRLTEAVPKAQLDTLLAAFKGSEAVLGTFIEEALGSDPAMLDGMLRLGCDGDAGKLKTLIGKFPGPPASTDLCGLIVDGGLNGRPEVLAAILKSGCAADPDRFAAFVDEMKDPADQKKLAGLLDQGGMGAAPGVLGALVEQTGNANLLKALGAHFDDAPKRAKLAALVGRGGLGDAYPQDPRTLAALLDGPAAISPADLERMATSFAGQEDKLAAMMRAFNGTPDPTKPPVAAKRIKNLSAVFAGRPNPYDAMRDPFFTTIDTQNRASAAPRDGGQVAREAAAGAAGEAIAATAPALVRAHLASTLDAGAAARIAARAPGLGRAEREAVEAALALAHHVGAEAAALRTDGGAEATAKAAARTRAEALHQGPEPLSPQEIAEAEAAADAEALSAEQEARALAATLEAQDAALAPTLLAEAAQKIAAAVAGARMAVAAERRTGCLDAADALRAALDALLKRHAAQVLAKAPSPDAGAALRAGMAATDAERMLQAAGLANAALTAALAAASSGAQEAALALSGADALALSPTAKADAQERAARAAVALTGIDPPEGGAVTTALEDAKKRAIAARDDAAALARALDAAPAPVDPALISRAAAAADRAVNAAAGTVDDALRAETLAAATAAAKAVAKAAERLATQASAGATLNEPSATDALTAAGAGRAALEAMQGQPGIAPTAIADMRVALEAGNRAAQMAALARQIETDPAASAKAEAAAREAAETSAGGPADQPARDAAIKAANDAADLCAQEADQQATALGLLAPPTHTAIKSAQDAADAAVRAAALTPDPAKRANALAKARLAMAAVALALQTYATLKTDAATTAKTADATTRTGTAVTAQRAIHNNVRNAIVVTKNNYAAAHYYGTPHQQAIARQTIANARAAYAGPRATKETRMNEAKAAADSAAAAQLRVWTEADAPTQAAALDAARARARADLPGASIEDKRDAIGAERTLAEKTATVARTKAAHEITTVLVQPAGPAAMPAPNAAFASAAAPPDGLMSAAIQLKAAVAAATERVEAAARAHDAAQKALETKNTAQMQIDRNQAKTALTLAETALEQLEPLAVRLKTKAAANVRIRARERAAANALVVGPVPWRNGIKAQCTAAYDATQKAAAMAALIVAQSFTTAGATVALPKGRDGMLQEAAKFALVALPVPPAQPATVIPPDTADMVHFSDRHTYEHYSFDPETLYYPDEMEDIVMFDMEDQANNRLAHDPDAIMREKQSFAKVNGFWPETVTHVEMAVFLDHVIADLGGRAPASTQGGLFNYLNHHVIYSATFPNSLGYHVVQVAAPPAPGPNPIDVKMSLKWIGADAKYSVGQFFPLNMPLTSFFDMVAIKKSVGK